LIEILRRRAAATPNAVAYRFLSSDQVAELTYAELERGVRGVAAMLEGIVRPGERALLVYPPGFAFLYAFFGCLSAGVIAVPVVPPLGRKRQHPAFLAIARDARPAVLLTLTDLVPLIRAALSYQPETSPSLIATDDLESRPSDEPRPIGPETIALLQYTSGSTSAPKGVRITHGNLLANLEAISRCNTSGGGEGVSWLPHFHDMGLIGGALLPLYQGFTVSLMPTFEVFKRPIRWLEAITRFRAAISPAPPFTLELCLRRISPAERARLDLAHWRVAFVGSEPISADLLDRFVAGFADVGFRREALVPCYGLAEATLLVTGNPAGASPNVKSFAAHALAEGRVECCREGTGRRLVGCGGVAPGVEVSIVDEAGEILGGDRVGEIWIRGETVSPGYWNDPRASDSPFAGRASDGRTWLRSGDLGFLHGDQLFVCGRTKDLIIIRGKNHHPRDIEATVEGCHNALIAGGVAAFSVDGSGSGEALVVIAELRSQSAASAEITTKIRAAIAQEHDLAALDVVLTESGAIPRTTSGKLRRSEARALYQRGEVPRWSS
jgi:acyl-CoA synthetase (AMP-forming)/AMP-acid ligase II